MGENSWQTFRAVGADDIGWEDDLFLENVFVQELDGAESLVSLAPTARTVWVEEATLRSLAR